MFELADLGSRMAHGFVNFSTVNVSMQWQETETKRNENFESVNISELTGKISEKVKRKIRRGIPCQYRRNIWFVASGGYDLYRREGDLWEKYKNSDLENVNNRNKYLFGNEMNISDYLPAEAEQQFLHFMKVFYVANSSIQYSPMITSIALCLLLFMEPRLAFLSLQAMINKSKDTSWYVAIDHIAFNASICALKEMSMKSCKSVVKYAEKNLEVSLSKVWLHFVPYLFLPSASLATVLTIFDSFVNEGRKILTRLCVSILISEKEALMKATTEASFIDIIHNTLVGLDSCTKLNKLMKEAFTITMSRSDQARIEERFVKAQEAIPLQLDLPSAHYRQRHPIPCRNEVSTLYPRNLHSLDSVTGGVLLTIYVFNRMMKHAPMEIRHYKARNVYNMTEHGTSFGRFLRSAETPGYYMLIVQTSKRTVAVLLSDCLQPGKGRYYGRASTFVYDVHSDAVYQKRSPDNLQYIFVSREDLIIGGPEPAIYLRNKFLKMASSPCATFGSPSFSVADEGDDIYEIELYKLERH